MTAESYNGSSWTEVSEMNTGRNNIKGSTKPHTSALAFGGQSPVQTSGTNLNETWNGSSWTETAELNTTTKMSRRWIRNFNSR